MCVYLRTYLLVYAQLNLPSMHISGVSRRWCKPGHLMDTTKLAIGVVYLVHSV